jgi:FkbM family methyltransferase
MKRYIILCAGNGERWNNYLNTPKHFIRVDGEIILQRTIKLIKRFDEKAEIFIVANDDIYKLDGTTLYKPTLDSNLSIDKFLSSEELWLDKDCTILFGDMFFTNSAMYRICVSNKEQPLLFYGLAGENKVTKKPYGEIYGISFNKEFSHNIKQHCDIIKQRGDLNIAGGWMLYRSINGLALDAHVIKDYFVEIHDFTDDFDNSNDYNSFMEQQKIINFGAIENIDHTNGAYHVPWVRDLIDKDRRNIKTILELGSGNGMDSIYLYNYYPYSKVYGFEANPGAIEICKKNLINFPEITLVEKAVSDKTERIKFYPVIDGRHLASAIYKVKPEYPEHFKQTEIEVDAIRLDEWMEQNKIEPIDMICMDIQGAALKALKGLGKYLKDVRYIIAELEVKPIYQEEDLLEDVKKYLNDFEIVGQSMVNEYYGDYVFKRRGI